MLVCRPRPRCPGTLFVFGTLPTRSTSTSTTSSITVSTSQPATQPEDSIFTTAESPWDHVFSDIEPVIAPTNSRVRMRLNNSNTRTGPISLSGREKGDGQTQNIMQRSSGVRHQRASITAREMSVFNEMFDLIFNAVSAQDGKSSVSGLGSGASSPSLARTSSSATSSSIPSFSGQTPSIGRAGGPLNDLFRKLRRQTSRVRWTSAIDEELDRKKETMELFNTDYELLQWVMMELFGDPQKWDEEAGGATTASSAKITKGKGEEICHPATAASSMDAATIPSSSSWSTSSSMKEHRVNHSIYPHLIAHAMRIFRTTYSNPSLSLAIFNHAAQVSIPSYVFGCTAPAYNELIEAKWEGWGDLEGVCNALEEMKANGVKIDGRTCIVVEKVRREVGEARPVGLGKIGTGPESGDAGADSVNLLARKAWEELGETEVMRHLHRMERLAIRDRSRKARSSPQEESWKSAVLEPDEDDEWGFDGWDKKMAGDVRQRQKVKSTSQDRVYPPTLDDWTTSDEEMALR